MGPKHNSNLMDVKTLNCLDDNSDKMRVDEQIKGKEVIYSSGQVKTSN